MGGSAGVPYCIRRGALLVYSKDIDPTGNDNPTQSFGKHQPDISTNPKLLLLALAYVFADASKDYTAGRF